MGRLPSVGRSLVRRSGRDIHAARASALGSTASAALGAAAVVWSILGLSGALGTPHPALSPPLTNATRAPLAALVLAGRARRGGVPRLVDVVGACVRSPLGRGGSSPVGSSWDGISCWPRPASD